MKIFIFFFTLFSFELFANQTQYACTEWKLVLSEYADEENSYLPLFTETKGVPYVGIEENNKFTLKNKFENTITTNYIGNYNDIIRIFSHIDSTHGAVSIFFLSWEKDEDYNIVYDKLEIQQVSYIPEYTYRSNCYLN